MNDRPFVKFADQDGRILRVRADRVESIVPTKWMQGVYHGPSSETQVHMMNGYVHRIPESHETVWTRIQRALEATQPPPSPSGDAAPPRTED